MKKNIIVNIILNLILYLNLNRVKSHLANTKMAVTSTVIKADWELIQGYLGVCLNNYINDQNLTYSFENFKECFYKSTEHNYDLGLTPDPCNVYNHKNTNIMPNMMGFMECFRTVCMTEHHNDNGYEQSYKRRKITSG